jgi:hypothetical protein
MKKDGGDMQIKATSITMEAQSITISASGTLAAEGKQIRLN